MKNGLSLGILSLITFCNIILNCGKNPSASQSEKLSIAVILDRKVETTQINNINARIKRYAFSTGRSTAIGKTILQNVERDSISFSIEYYSEDIIEDAHYVEWNLGKYTEPIEIDDLSEWKGATNAAH